MGSSHETTHPKEELVRLKPIVAFATAGAAGALVFGGVSIASAQEETTTTTPDATVEDDTTVPGDRDPARDGCPEKEGTSSGAGSEAEGSATNVSF